MVKDYTYAASFTEQDLPLLYDFASRVKESVTHDNINGIYHKPTLTDSYLKSCTDRYNDHHPILEVRNQKLEFNDVWKSEPDDLVVDVGHQQNINLILGTSTVEWRYHAVGNNTGTPVLGITNTTLSSESFPRIDMSTYRGWREYASMNLRFGAIWHFNGSPIVGEVGIFNASSAGIMLNRNIFSNNTVTNIAGSTPVLVFASVIEFVPIM